MSEQELFEQAVMGVVNQGVLSKDNLGVCYYRHPNDSSIRCAVGHIISDDGYSPEMESRSVNAIINAKHRFDISFPDWADVLQRCHDFDADTVEEFIRNVVYQFKIAYPSINTEFLKQYMQV